MSSSQEVGKVILTYNSLFGLCYTVNQRVRTWQLLNWSWKWQGMGQDVFKWTVQLSAQQEFYFSYGQGVESRLIRQCMHTHSSPVQWHSQPPAWEHVELSLAPPRSPLPYSTSSQEYPIAWRDDSSRNMTFKSRSRSFYLHLSIRSHLSTGRILPCRIPARQSSNYGLG